MYSLNLDADNRILSACVCLDGFEYENIVETLPEGNLADYKYINGEYILDPLPEPQPEPEPPTQTEINTANIDYIAMMTDIELPTEV